MSKWKMQLRELRLFIAFVFSQSCERFGFCDVSGGYDDKARLRGVRFVRVWGCDEWQGSEDSWYCKACKVWVKMIRVWELYRV